jgi:lambda family phage tail tape measure protein
MEAEQQREQLMQTVTSNIESAFMSVVDGSKSVVDAFRSMLRNIILAVYEQKVAQPAATAIGSLIDKGIAAIFSANGNVFNQGMHVKAYADGGVVNRTTMFPMRSGVGIMGEAGPEAIMPLKRGKNGKLGVQMEGSSQPVVVNQYFNMSANGDESVKRIIRQETPRIAEQAKAAVVDAKRRGGSYGRSF